MKGTVSGGFLQRAGGRCEPVKSDVESTPEWEVI